MSLLTAPQVKYLSPGLERISGERCLETRELRQWSAAPQYYLTTPSEQKGSPLNRKVSVTVLQASVNVGSREMVEPLRS
ncbi:MAG: hypothetical protein E6H10_11430 [Bacteroidetes bacterium]|nr:MAG: hypothetical protein E6H10_11430 [Bacteroidota bacterium]